MGNAGVESTNQFGEVHVSQNSHDDDLFSILWVQSLECSQGSQYREDITQTEIIMHLQSYKRDQNMCIYTSAIACISSPQR